MANLHQYCIHMYVFVYAICAYSAAEDSSPDKDINVSYKQCLQKCQAWKECFVMEYLSLFKMCRYFKSLEDSCGKDRELCEPQSNVQYYIKSNVWNYTDTPLVCPAPPKIAEARMFGNLRKIGSKIKYTCNKNSSIVHIIECLNNSTWSIPQESLKCPVGCDKPEFESYQRVKVDGSVEQVNDTHYAVTLACTKNDIEIEPIRKLYCDVYEGIWQYQEYVCCRLFQNKNNDLSRYLVYDLRTDSRRLQTVNLDGEYDIGEKCFYKNGSFWRQDSDAIIQSVVVNVKNSTDVVHKFEFCKHDSPCSSNSWFSVVSLRSWHKHQVLMSDELTSNTYFYINTSWIGPFVQFTVTTEENGQPCTSPSWLTVTDDTLECNQENRSSVRVLYLKNKAKLFNDSDTEEATALRIWAYYDD